MVRTSKKDKEEKDKDIEKELHQIIELVNSANLEELEIREGKKRVRIKKKVIREKEKLVSEEFTPEISEEVKEDFIETDKYEKVISPLTGIFYRAPALDDEPYVEEGDVIEAGKTLCLIEAMKLFNEIKSDMDGKIVKIMVKNGEQVKEGQILFLLESNIEDIK
ncbi:MAG: biotin/lipoyl-binding protein [bacterium]|nr:biotin/lipoyl-binding protein [bacterium]